MRLVLWFTNQYLLWKENLSLTDFEIREKEILTFLLLWR